jgi:hypothetical protein
MVSLTFAFGWYRRWEGWSSNTFTVTAVLAMALPVALAAWIGSGQTASEHLRRMFRVRIYVLAMSTRMLMLLQLIAVLSLMANYCIGLHNYPREVAGWILAPATLTMTASTILTTWYRRRALRHFWLFIGILGCAASLWWMSTVDNFTSKDQLALMIGCWGLFLGLFPPAFLQDEVEGLDPRDALYGGALAAVFFVVPLVVIPSMTSTIVSVWTARALDAERLNLRPNRPEVAESFARVAGYYEQRGEGAPASSQMASGVLGGFARAEAAVFGVQTGLRFLSLIVGGIGLLVAVPLLLSQTAPPANGRAGPSPRP